MLKVGLEKRHFRMTKLFSFYNNEIHMININEPIRRFNKIHNLVLVKIVSALNGIDTKYPNLRNMTKISFESWFGKKKDIFQVQNCFCFTV